MAWIDHYLHDGQPSQPKHHLPGVHGAILLGESDGSSLEYRTSSAWTFSENRQLNSIAA
jgi:hypothetical protein